MPKYLLIAIVCVLGALASAALWLDRDGSGTGWRTEKSIAETQDITASPGAVYSTKFPDMKGNIQSLGQWDRKLLIVNFWATWCGPCKEEIPILIKLQSTFGARGLQIVGIAADSPAKVVNFSESVRMNYPVLVDEAGALEFSRRLGNRLGLLPHTVVFRPGGEVIYAKLGPITEIELGDIIDKNSPTSPKID